jgi:hypothetical protein
MVGRQRAGRLKQPSATVPDSESVKVMSGTIYCSERSNAVHDDEIDNGAQFDHAVSFTDGVEASRATSRSSSPGLGRQGRFGHADTLMRTL